MIVTAALSVLILTAVLQLYFYLRFFRHVGNIHADAEQGLTHRAQVPQLAPLALSVIICARDEAENLRANLPSVLNQDYRDENGRAAFEVIVVNDSSRDDSGSLLQEFQQQFSNLKTVSIAPDAPRDFPGKKFPLSLGIRAASHELIVCTDADCSPATASWLHFMAAPFAKGKSIVAGYGGYRKYPGLLNWFIRLETMQTFFLYYTFWKGGAPYMAVGRNMAYRKELFLKAGKAPQWSALPSGDDDLLIQLCGTRENMSVVTHPAAATWSEPKRSFEEYLLQKKRHVSTGKYYKLQSKILLALYALMQFLSLQAPVWLLVYAVVAILERRNAEPEIALMIVLAGAPFLTYSAMKRSSSRLRDTAGQVSWILFSFCWLVYNTVLAPWILWKTKQRWK
jgi:cellulose synthase/poly-beta-1,6-N-acetylglucosamine synthase-like glycosyltransferase